MTSAKVIFQWGGKIQKTFDTLKHKIVTTPILALPNIQQPFEFDIDASGYAMWAVLMQRRRPICFHLETFSKEMMGYPTYDK